MPSYRESGESTIYTVVKIQTCSGQPLLVSGNTNVSGTVSISGASFINDRLETEPLGIPTVARVITVTTGNTNTALTSGITRISIRATGTNMFYAVGSGSQTATLSGHFIANGERLDIGTPLSSPNVAVICPSGSSGVLYLSELS